MGRSKLRFAKTTYLWLQYIWTREIRICKYALYLITPEKRLGNQKKLSEWQTEYHENMSSRWNELERGVSAMESHRKHMPVWQYKKAQRLDKQAEKIKMALEDINAFNAGKKRDEALEALADWLPQAEQFTALTKNTQKYIDQLSDANSVLSRKLQEKEERFSELSMEAVHMRHTLKSQRRLIDSIQPEV